MGFIIPTGFDRGDGVTNLPSQPQNDPGAAGTFGTPTPNSARIKTFGGATQPGQEDPDSPEIERAEQATFMHRIKTSWTTGLQLIAGLSRGVYLQDSGQLQSPGTVTRVLSARLKSLRGDNAEVSVIAESISFDTPPEEFQDVPVDSGFDIIKHPRYGWALNPVLGDNSATIPVGNIFVSPTDLKSCLIRMIQTYRDAPFFPSADQVNGIVQSQIMSQLQVNSLNKSYITVRYKNQAFNPNPADGVIANPPMWDGLTADTPTVNAPYFLVNVPVDFNDPTNAITIAVAATKEIISKLWRGEDVPYLTGRQITWSQFFFAPVFLHPGGIIQSPVGIVNDFFMGPSQNGTDTIFDQFPLDNPQSYSQDGFPDGLLNISWLRKADEVEYQRTWFKITHTWIGLPNGSWDVDLYDVGIRPQNANDFDQLIS